MPLEPLEERNSEMDAIGLRPLTSGSSFRSVVRSRNGSNKTTLYWWSTARVHRSTLCPKGQHPFADNPGTR